jgi:hypothetical protein
MIKKLNKDETPSILPVSRGRNTMLRAMLLQLEIGESLFMPREDWKSKNSPFYIIAYIKKTKGFLYDYGFKIDGTGWLFKRVK